MKNEQNKKIVIVNQDSGYLMIDLANAYIEAGFEVSLVTGRISERNKSLNQKVHVCKIKKYNRATFTTRLISWIIASIQISLRVIFQFRNSHILFVSNPPIGAWINAFLNRDFSLLIYDVYPDALEEIGYANKDSFIYRIWGRFNRITYRKAKRIITISESMVETMQHYAGNKKIEIIPIWTDNNYLKPVDETNNIFIKNHHLEGKFIVLYSGNLGETANAEVMVDLAIKLRDESNIQFVIIGEGSQKKQISQRIEEFGLQNCLFLPKQSAEMFPFSLASANLALVSLNKSAGRIALPSKLYSLLSVGVPILALCDKESALEKIVDKYNIGKCFDFDSLDDANGFILSISKDQQLQVDYKTNVLVASKKYDDSNVLKFII
ncbi:MAG: glycosyltransferase family 4 protein [Bacteroidales bacterium]